MRRFIYIACVSVLDNAPMYSVTETDAIFLFVKLIILWII